MGFQGASQADSCTNLSSPVRLLSDMANGSPFTIDFVLSRDIPPFLSLPPILLLLLLLLLFLLATRLMSAQEPCSCWDEGRAYSWKSGDTDRWPCCLACAVCIVMVISLSPLG